MRPQPGGLTHAEGVTPTVRGSIAAAFAGDGAALDVFVRVPANAKAEVTVPGETVWVDHRPRPGGTVELGAGCHFVSSRGAGLAADSVLAFATAQAARSRSPPTAASAAPCRPR